MELINLSKSTDLYNDITSGSFDNRINHFWLGLREYESIWTLQKILHSMVVENNINDLVLYLEHNHVYTLGKNSNLNHILSSKLDKIKIVHTDRGGDVTYHGPGQLIGYPIFNLKNFTKSVSWYMRTLEQAIINSIQSLKIDSHVKDGLTGVWVGDEKICAMGVRMAKWSTMHGFALNVNTNLNYFDGLIPCGIFEYGITSISKNSNIDIDTYKVAETVAVNFEKLFLDEKIKLLERV